MGIRRLVEYLDDIQKTSAELCDSLSRANIRKKTLPKHINLVLPEMKYNDLVFVLRGMVKAFRLNEDGQEQIFCMWKEDEFIVLEDCFFYNECSELYVAPVETCEVLIIRNEQYERYAAKFPELGVYRERIMIAHSKKKGKLLSIIGQAPGDRYCLFQKAFPDLAYRLSDRDVCSFLCISMKTLSRSKGLGCRW